MTLHVKKLGSAQTADDIDMTTPYVALYQGGRLQLNRSIEAESMERLDENTEYPVYVSRVLDSRTVVAHIINEPFVVDGRPERDEESAPPAREFRREGGEFRERPRFGREGFGREGGRREEFGGRRREGFDRRGGRGRDRRREFGPRDGEGRSRGFREERPRRAEAMEAPPLGDALLVESDGTAALLPRLQLAAVRLQRAVLNREPIVLRFHADTDGYAAAAALDRALSPLLERVHGDRTRNFFIRAPSKTPYYHIEDAARDLTGALGERQRFGAKLPLIVILDNGSTPEDVLGLKLVAQYGLSVIVLDHHDPGPIVDGRCAADPFIAVHINPHLVGAPSGLASGMLAAELAHLLAPQGPVADLAALSGTADKSQLPELERYLDLSGRPREHFSRLAACVDFAAYTLRHMDSPVLMRDLLGADAALQEKLMAVLIEEISRQRALMQPVVEKYAQKKRVGKATMLTIDGASSTLRGEFFSIAKTVRLMHDALRDGPTVSLGYTDDTVVFRADNVGSFDANEIIRRLAKERPHTGANGGGHAYAASLRFVPAARDEVLAFIEQHIAEKAG